MTCASWNRLSSMSVWMVVHQYSLFDQMWSANPDATPGLKPVHSISMFLDGMGKFILSVSFNYSLFISCCLTIQLLLTVLYTVDSQQSIPFSSFLNTSSSAISAVLSAWEYHVDHRQCLLQSSDRCIVRLSLLIVSPFGLALINKSRLKHKWSVASTYYCYRQLIIGE